RGRRDESPEDDPGALERAGAHRVRRWGPRWRPDPEGTPPGGRGRLHRPRPARQGSRRAHPEADHEVPAEQDPRGPVRRDVRPLGPGLQSGVRVPRTEAREWSATPRRAETRVPAGTARAAGTPRGTAARAADPYDEGPQPQGREVA